MIKLERIIRESMPVRFVINKSKKISLPGFEGLPLYDVVSFFYNRCRR